MPHTELSADILAAVAARIDENTKRSLISLQELVENTQFSKQEIMMMYRGFKQVRVKRFRLLQAKYFDRLRI